MIEQRYRLASGGRVDRARPLHFRFNGREMAGFEGDSLASALMANGVRVLGRSFKYHRPRGIWSAGAEEPNALLGVGLGARHEPNVVATLQPLYEGLSARSQNCFPSPLFDLGALNSLAAPFLSAGFYYKTFIWPGLRAWMLYEKLIRRAAGMGRVAANPDPDRYEKRHGFCDVLVVGAGPAGLAAARAAAAAGARVALIDEQCEFGGQLLRERESLDDADALDWVARTRGELAAQSTVTLLPASTAFGLYDDGGVGVLERCLGAAALPAAGAPRARLWHWRAHQVVLATGAFERGLAFSGNDKPGTLQANAARAYVNRYGVIPGHRALVATNNDNAVRTALDLQAAGVVVEAVLDARERTGEAAAAALRGAGIVLRNGQGIARAEGWQQVTGARLCDRRGAATGTARAELIATSGGWTPALQLHSMVGSAPVWRGRDACFVPGELPAHVHSAGACEARWDTAGCLAAGAAAGEAAARAAGFTAVAPPLPRATPAFDDQPGTEAMWRAMAPGGAVFLDQQHDVAVKDVELAHREGYRSVEHLKRYTTLGMAGDQGRSSNVPALAIMAELRGTSIEAVGTTTFRPPVSPVPLGVFGGLERGPHFKPFRRSSMQAWHEARGAVFQEVGLWRRPQYYPIGAESLEAAYRREAAHVREKVGMVDVSTLGKIQINGPDAAEFLNRVYVNNWLKLPLAKARYGLMLREDGIVLDDGTTSRWGEQDYLMTTTTAQAGPVLAHMERLLQVVWPQLQVRVCSTTDQWAAMAVAGPRARAVLQECVVGLELSNAAFPFMAVGEAAIAGVPVRVLRISFSGELAYEVLAPSGHGARVWAAIMAAGEDHEIIPYGTEAMGALRIEKGHLTGAELDGRTALGDVGMAALANPKKDFIGRVLMRREGLQDPTRPRLTGLRSIDPAEPLQAGAILLDSAEASAGADKLGHVSSVTWSPALDGHIALGFLRGAADRCGDTLYAVYPLRDRAVAVQVCSPCFVDPDGERMRA